MKDDTTNKKPDQNVTRLWLRDKNGRDFKNVMELLMDTAENVDHALNESEAFTGCLSLNEVDEYLARHIDIHGILRSYQGLQHHFDNRETGQVILHLFTWLISDFDITEEDVTKAMLERLPGLKDVRSRLSNSIFHYFYRYVKNGATGDPVYDKYVHTLIFQLDHWGDDPVREGD